MNRTILGVVRFLNGFSWRRLDPRHTSHQHQSHIGEDGRWWMTRRRSLHCQSIECRQHRDGIPADNGQYVYVGFSRRKIPRSSAYTISEKAIRFRHPDYDPDRAQKLIISSMSRHLSTRNILFKSMHAFLSNLANRQTNKQTNAGKDIYLLLCLR